MDNKLTKITDFTDWTYIVSTTSVPDSKQPLFSRTLSNCKLTQKLYFLDDVTKEWKDYAASPTSYPFVTSFVDGPNLFDVDIGKITIFADRTLASNYWQPYKVYKAK